MPEKKETKSGDSFILDWNFYVFFPPTFLHSGSLDLAYGDGIIYLVLIAKTDSFRNKILAKGHNLSPWLGQLIQFGLNFGFVRISVLVLSSSGVLSSGWAEQNFLQQRNKTRRNLKLWNQQQHWSCQNEKTSKNSSTQREGIIWI